MKIRNTTKQMMSFPVVPLDDPSSQWGIEVRDGKGNLLALKSTPPFNALTNKPAQTQQPGIIPPELLKDIHSGSWRAIFLKPKDEDIFNYDLRSSFDLPKGAEIYVVVFVKSASGRKIASNSLHLKMPK